MNWVDQERVTQTVNKSEMKKSVINGNIKNYTGTNTGKNRKLQVKTCQICTKNFLATDSDYISFQRNCFDLPSNQSLLINSAPDRSKLIKTQFNAKKIMPKMCTVRPTHLPKN